MSSVSSSPEDDKVEQPLFGRFYHVSRDCVQSGSNEFNFRFAKVRKNDTILIERCSFNNCRCVAVGREKGITFAQIRTITGFQGHIDTSCLSRQSLEIHCPICQYQAVSEHEFFQHMTDHHLEPLLKNLIGNNQYSYRCPMVKCNHKKGESFRDKDDLLEHMFDVRNDSGRNNFLQMFVRLCMKNSTTTSSTTDDYEQQVQINQLQEKLAQQNHEFAQKCSELNKLRAKHDELLEINSVCDNQEKMHQRSLYDKDREIKELEELRVKSDLEKERLNGEIQFYKDQRKQGKELCNQIQSLNHELTQENEKNKSQVDALNKQLQQIREQLQEAQAQNQSLVNDYNAEKTNLATKSQELADKTSELNDLRAKHNELLEINSICDNKEKRHQGSLYDKDKQIKELEKELKQKRSENVQVAMLRAQMMKVKEVANQEVAQMKQILTLRDQEINVLRQTGMSMKTEPK